MSYSYKVIPFTGQSRGDLSPSDVAQQLEITISQYAREGWEFIQLANVNVEVQPGCVAGLFGSQAEYVRCDQLIFRLQMPTVSSNASEREVSRRSGNTAALSNASQTQESDVGARSPYQPERLYGGKIACWKCGAANDPRQIRCSQCESELYERIT